MYEYVLSRWISWCLETPCYFTAFTTNYTKCTYIVVVLRFINIPDIFERFTWENSAFHFVYVRIHNVYVYIKRMLAFFYEIVHGFPPCYCYPYNKNTYRSLYISFPFVYKVVFADISICTTGSSERQTQIHHFLFREKLISFVVLGWKQQQRKSFRMKGRSV